MKPAHWFNFQNKNIAAITIGFFFLFGGLDGAQQYAVPILETEGKGDVMLQAMIVLYGTFFLTNSIGPFLVGILGTRRSLIFGALAYPTFPLAIASANSICLTISGFFVGLGATLLWNSSGQLVAGYSAPEMFGRNQGRKYSALLLGGFVGALIGGLLITRVSSGWLFLGFALVTAIGASAFMLLDHAEEAPREKQSLGLEYLVRKEILLIAPLVIGGYYLMFLSMSAMKLDILHRFDLATVGLIGIVLRLSSSYGALKSGALSDSSINKVLLISLIACSGIVGVAIFMAFNSLGAIAAASLLIGFSYSAVYPVTTALLRERWGGDERDFNAALGAFHFYNTGGMVAGLAASRYSTPHTCMAAALILLGVSLPLLWVFNKKFPRSSSRH